MPPIYVPSYLFPGSESHVGAAFVSLFGDTLSMLRKLFFTASPSSQPLVISGSGTLGWDLVAANLTERGDEVLVLHSGYFADSFADCLETYGASVTQLKAPIGDRPQLEAVEGALKEKKYKMLTVTHVDTSTGVFSEIESVSKLVHRISPETLVVVDAVCSAGCEEIQFDEWGLDVVLTASQKAIGCPAGLCIVMFSGRAIDTYQNRRTPPSSYFASLKNWLPSKNPPFIPLSAICQVNYSTVMKAYEAKTPAYFATPPPQLIHALHTSLSQILARPLFDRFDAHRAASQWIKAKLRALGLRQLAVRSGNQANGMTAVYLPNGLNQKEVLAKVLSRGVVMAGGLHKEIKDRYIRIGHMGVSVTDESRKDLEQAVEALRDSLKEVGYKVPAEEES